MQKTYRSPPKTRRESSGRFLFLRGSFDATPCEQLAATHATYSLKARANPRDNRDSLSMPTRYNRRRAFPSARPYGRSLLRPVGSPRVYGACKAVRHTPYVIFHASTRTRLFRPKRSRDIYCSAPAGSSEAKNLELGKLPELPRIVTPVPARLLPFHATCSPQAA